MYMTDLSVNAVRHIGSIGATRTPLSFRKLFEEDEEYSSDEENHFNALMSNEALQAQHDTASHKKDTLKHENIHDHDSRHVEAPKKIVLKAITDLLGCSFAQGNALERDTDIKDCSGSQTARMTAPLDFRGNETYTCSVAIVNTSLSGSELSLFGNAGSLEAVFSVADESQYNFLMEKKQTLSKYLDNLMPGCNITLSIQWKDDNEP